ncbi:hypothetical protein [Lacipirellula sp.]|uniref:hypothetical protein n=1 Tax=Lacipirellula sp. TaxID=2691419 RepID=UPI003D10629F
MRVHVEDGIRERRAATFLLNDDPAATFVATVPAFATLALVATLPVCSVTATGTDRTDDRPAIDAITSGRSTLALGPTVARVGVATIGSQLPASLK